MMEGMDHMHEYMRRLNLAMEKGIIDAGSAAVAEVHHDDNGKRKCGIYSRTYPP